MRLLILTYAFPPSRHTNAKRPYYMARAFAEAGWEVDVYTGPLGMVPGDSELPGHPALRVFRVADWITDMLQKPGQRGPLRSLFTKVLFGLMWPDPYAPWVLRTLRACGGGRGYDRVLVYIFPASLLLCGAPRNLVTRRWVFDFQESVTPQWQRLLRRSPWAPRRPSSCATSGMGTLFMLAVKS